MLKMKRGKCEYDFVEIMACPSGCLNGGGQLKVVDSHERREGPEESRQRLLRVGEVFNDVVVARPELSKLSMFLFGPLDGTLSTGIFGGPMSPVAIQLLHTRFQAVPKLEQIAPLAVKW